ncbi:MOP flippase family protein [Enterobacter hormaechei]|uniref:MOP flippase family protein n=1 Tax=Enterobacter hormaechei TaxID=158836 RepID=UPI00079B8825|nr:MOP flippase family protein [Enterobacter hormaechei]CAE7611136.1 Teichuronic acid biosynthesis protein TuaB [Enterobacter cloacae]EKY3878398.1 MOP flippase family protein [Enterobacter hormaechei]ELC0816606.1 MOP flippase family protein [Enterobacter hormaechei]MCD6628416.1 MOP flippase family protein [Enterobacter hormaechei]MCU2898038.1 MOP flippase family protein [Enterobacter hormaechei subsp. steigerwaltii]
MSIYDNTKWVALSQVFKILMQLTSLTVLTRLVSPHDYGIMALATILINFITILRDLGTSSALIQKKQVNQLVKSSVFWLNTILGLFLFVIIYTSSGEIASFFNEPELENVLKIISITFPIVCTAASHQALLERESKFKLIASIEIVSSFSGLIVALFMAFNGFGVYSLVLQVMIYSLVSSCLFWKYHCWKPSFAINLKELRGVFKFSLNLTVFNIVSFFSRNIDSTLIGKFFSSYILGAYSLAYRIMLFPLQNVTLVATRALYPVLSKHQDDEVEIRKIFIQTVQVISSLTLPIVCIIVMLSHELIIYLFGSQWALTATILIWLAPSGFVQSIINSIGCFFAAKGRTDIIMKLSIASCLVIVFFVLLGVQFNILIMTQFYFLANIINGICMMSFALTLLKCPLSKLMLAFSAPVISSFSIVLTITLINIMLNENTGLFYFILKIFVGCTAYLITYRLFFRSALQNILPGKLRKILLLS